MAKGQFKVMDSDIHVDEPHDLWLKYMEPRFKDRAPRFSPIDGSNTNPSTKRRSAASKPLVTRRPAPIIR